MRKILAISFIFLPALAGVFAQDNIASKPENTNATSQNSYSESKPYVPIKFENKKNKNKREKKQKKDSNKQNLAQELQAQTIQSIDSPGNDAKKFDIPVSVFTINGNPVLNLTKSDFKVFINDSEQEISSVEIEEPEPLNLILILDASPSSKIEDIKRFASELIAILKPEDKVQVIKFHSNTKVLTELTNDRQLIEKAIRKLDVGDGTAIYDAVSSILNKRINTIQDRKTVVLLSDGVDTTSNDKTYETSLIEVEKSDAMFFTFYFDTFENISKLKTFPSNLQFPVPPLVRPSTHGMTKEEYELGKKYLNDLAWISGGQAFEVTQPNIQKNDLLTVLKILKPQYSIRLNLLKAPASEQRQQIRVRVYRPGLTVHARGSCIAGNK